MYTYGSKINNTNNQVSYTNQNTTNTNLLGKGGLDETKVRHPFIPEETTITVCPPPPKVVNCRCNQISYYRAVLGDLAINNKSKQTDGPRLYRPPTLCEGPYDNCVVSNNSFPGAIATQVVKNLCGGWVLDFRYWLPMRCTTQSSIDNEKIIGAVRVMIYQGPVSNPTSIRYRKSWGWCAVANSEGGCAESSPAVQPPRAGTLPMKEYGVSIDNPTFTSCEQAFAQYITRPPSVIAWTALGYPAGASWGEENMIEHGLNPNQGVPYVDWENPDTTWDTTIE